MRRINGFKGAILAACIATALVSMSAMATDPGAQQLPGMGTIVSGHVNAGSATNGTQTIVVGNATDTGLAKAVINWGSGSDINATQPAGFNVGANSALTFNDGTTNGSGTYGAAILNIDSSGNPSQIFGSLTGVGTSIFVANANGIVVGSGATISSTAGVGLIANNTLKGTGSDFGGTAGSIVYNGTGGDVTVLKGASINGTSLLVAGGGNVNVNLGALKGPSSSATLSAGMPSANAGTSASKNPNASLTTSGVLASGVSLAGFSSAGSAANSGTLALDTDSVGGLFTNTGNLTLPATNGAVYNSGQLTTTATTTFSSLTNDGNYVGRSLQIKGGGDLVNNGRLSSVLVTVTDGNITNTGTIVGVYGLSTASDKHAVAGAQYSLFNTGTVTSFGQLTIDANRTSRGTSSNNTSGGSLYSTGTIQLAQRAKLQMKGWNDVTLGGLVQTGSGSGAVNVSPTNPIGELVLSAGGYNATVDTPTFFTNGVLSVLTPVAVSGAILHGRQIKVMSNISSVNSSAQTTGKITIVAGSAMTNDYAITVGEGATISAFLISVKGPTYLVAPTDGRVVQPNVLLQGKLAGGSIFLGDTDGPLSDVFSGPNGGLAMIGTAPSVTIAAAGTVGNAPELDANNFRFNYLPIKARGTLALVLKAGRYLTTPGSINLLVDGNVKLTPPSYASSPAIYGTGSASSPSTVPNTPLVLQSTGNISTGTNNFYWPGYVYLGNIGRNSDGSVAPGTLGSGTITLGGKLSNVLPGSTDSGGGIEFITQNPLNMGSYTVTTNANNAISFGTDALTQQYASGALGNGLFYGGTQGNGNVVNYGPLNPAMFQTDTPKADPTSM